MPPLAAILADMFPIYEETLSYEAARGTHRELDLPLLVRRSLGARGVEISEAQAQEWHRAQWISETRYGGSQLYPDTIDVLRKLRSAGVAIGINSNRPCTGDMALPGLRDAGIAPYVDDVVCSGDTGFVKPHPSTFELVLERLGVPAGAAVMVGDSAEGDMAGAKAVGMRTVWKLNGRYDLPPCADADFAIHDLGELLLLPVMPRPARSLVTTESLSPHEDGNEGRY